MSIAGAVAEIATQQDYFWALAAFGWTAVALAWWRCRHDQVLKWVPWAAATGLLIAAIEVSLLATPVKGRPFLQPRLAWDAALGATTFFLAAGWLWAAARTTRQRLLVIATVTALIALGVLATRGVLPPGFEVARVSAERAERLQGLPATRSVATVAWTDVLGWKINLQIRVSTFAHLAGGWLPAWCVLAAALAHARRLRNAERLVLLALLLTIAAIWIGTAGPLAEAANYPRVFTEFSVFGPPAALLHLGAAICMLRFFWGPAGRTDRTTIPEAGAESRTLLLLTATWLAMGFVLAAGMGRLARNPLEAGAVGRARAAVVAVDSRLVARVLAEDFKIAGFTGDKTPSGVDRRAIAPVLAGGMLIPVEQALQAITDANPDAISASVVILRDGLIMRLCSATRTPGWRTNVPVHRDATAADLAAWKERRAWFEPPNDYLDGTIAQAYAPLVTPEGTMTGWLWIRFSAATWHAGQLQARLQAFASTGLGLGLLGLFFRWREESRHREKARLAALTAAAADQAKTSFLAKVSHELRTPIQSILGYGELIAQQPLAAETRRWLESLRSHGQLLTRLVNDLIDLSSLQAGAFRLRPSPGNLGALVRSVTDSLRLRATAKGLRIYCTTAATMDGGHLFDAERLRQVLLNLVNNAIKFTELGSVTVELTAVEGDPTTVELRVRDTGPGIAPDDQAKLFQPFSRLETADGTEGAGLGLALSRGLCVAMGGDLRVESDGGTGSTFIARLRLPSAPLPTPAPATDIGSLVGRRVLVADDNTLVRELFVSCLRSYGAECEAVADGLAAWERATHDPFDVVVLDISMPWLDGFETTRRLRRTAPKTLRIVGVSAHATATEQAEALGAGMNAFLVKPVALADLVQAVGTGKETLPSPGPHPMPTLEHLREMFAREARQLQTELREASAAGDRERLRQRVHYVKNSADIARYDELGLRCAQLESILHAGGADATRLVTEIDAALTALAMPR